MPVVRTHLERGRISGWDPFLNFASHASATFLVVVMAYNASVIKCLPTAFRSLSGERSGLRGRDQEA